MYELGLLTFGSLSSWICTYFNVRMAADQQNIPEDQPNNDQLDHTGITPELRLTRYLYIGKEISEYHPGHWFSHDYYSTTKIPSINELASIAEKEILPVTLINKAFSEGLVPNPETLVFALAVCARQSKSKPLRHAAYSAIQNICASPQHFLLFVKFVCEISKRGEDYVTGWGNGLRKAVQKWYNGKSPMELAKIVTRYKGRYGWKHKDVLKLAHISVPSIPHAVVYEYIMKDMTGVTALLETKLKNCPEAKSAEVEEIISYLKVIENFKHCEDEHRTAALLETSGLTLDHVPGHMLKSKEVWSSLISSMNLTEILNSLQRIHNMGFLSDGDHVVTKIVDIINETNARLENIHPIKLFLAVKDYENCGKPLSFEKRKVKNEAKKPFPPPPQPNKDIVSALYNIVDTSYSYLKPTDLRYLITINVTSKSEQNSAWHCGNISAADAGCLLALSLLRVEENVTVAAFKTNGIQTFSVPKLETLSEIKKRLNFLSSGLPNFGQPISWATNKKDDYDVFINVADQVNRKNDSSKAEIEKYRIQQNKPNAKVVNCIVSCSASYAKKCKDGNILTICGFDANVPKVIEAFVKSLF